MNRWKIAFWACLALLVVVIIGSAYTILDQAVTLTYQKDGYTKTENDLKTIADMLDSGKISKADIVEELKKRTTDTDAGFSQDTIPLDRLSLIFENDTLKNVAWQW